MKNADKFKDVFGMYATELWSIPEGEFLRWLNSECTETEQGWIPCSERLPEEEDSIFAKFYSTDRWRETMMRKRSDRVIVTAEYQNGNRITDVAGTCDGKWVNSIPSLDRKIIAWMPLPAAYKEKK